MSAISACAALGGASAITVAGWLSCTRAEFTIRRQHLRTIFKKTWPLGKWLLLGRVTVQAQKNIAYWLVILIAGAATAGVYAACMSIVGLAKPAIYLIGDALIPKLALARKNDGGRGLWREAVRNTMVIASVVLPLGLAVLLMGEPVMRFFYRGTQYEGLWLHAHGISVGSVCRGCHHTGINFTGGHEAPSRDRYNSCGRSGSYGNSCLHIDRRVGSIGCGLWVPRRSRGRWDYALAGVPQPRCKNQ